MSRHLAVLRRQGIVARRNQGDRVFYCIKAPTVVKLCAIVCGGRAERLATGPEELPSPDRWRGAGISLD